MLGALPPATSAPEGPSAGAPERFVARDAAQHLSLLEIEQIEWFESAGNYVRVHSRGQSYTMRTTMDRVAQRLVMRPRFIRVRRSAIVNTRAIASLERYEKSAFVIHLRERRKRHLESFLTNGTPSPVARGAAVAQRGSDAGERVGLRRDRCWGASHERVTQPRVASNHQGVGLV